MAPIGLVPVVAFLSCLVGLSIGSFLGAVIGLVLGLIVGFAIFVSIRIFNIKRDSYKNLQSLDKNKDDLAPNLAPASSDKLKQQGVNVPSSLLTITQAPQNLDSPDPKVKTDSAKSNANGAASSSDAAKDQNKGSPSADGTKSADNANGSTNDSSSDGKSGSYIMSDDVDSDDVEQAVLLAAERAAEPVLYGGLPPENQYELLAAQCERIPREWLRWYPSIQQLAELCYTVKIIDDDFFHPQWRDIAETLDRQQFRYFSHVTIAGNLEAIKVYGLLSQLRSARALNPKIEPAVSDEYAAMAKDSSGKRPNMLDNVHLSFCQRQVDNDEEELDPFDAVVVRVHPLVACFKDTVFTNVSPLSLNCKFGSGKSGLKLVDFPAIKYNATIDRDATPELFARHQAEALVKGIVPRIFLTIPNIKIATLLKDSAGISTSSDSSISSSSDSSSSIETSDSSSSS